MACNTTCWAACGGCGGGCSGSASGSTSPGLPKPDGGTCWQRVSGRSNQPGYDDGTRNGQPDCWCGRDCGGGCSNCSGGGCSGDCSGDCSGCSGCSGCSSCSGTCEGLCNNGCSGNADNDAYNRLKGKQLVDYITNEDWDDLASILTQCYKCKLLAKDSEYPNNLWPVSEYDFITSSFIKTLIEKLKEVNTSSSINSDSNGIVYNLIPLSFAQQMLDDTVNAYTIVHPNNKKS